VDARRHLQLRSVLYEMVTGRGAFRGDTNVSTLAAIIKEEPAPIESPDPARSGEGHQALPAEGPAHRFQHMDDLKVALEELKEESDSGKLAAAAPAVTSRRRTLVWVVAEPLCSLGRRSHVVLEIKGRDTGSELRAVPLTANAATRRIPASLQTEASSVLLERRQAGLQQP